MADKICKCCGATKPLEAFSLGNNRRPIGVCKECRRQQQIIANYRNVPAAELTTTQALRYQTALEYMNRCKNATGFVTGKYSSKIGMPTPSAPSPTGQSIKNLTAKYVAAQQHRKQLEELGVPTQAPTVEMIRTCTAEFLVDCGYTQKECFDVLDNLITSNDPEYDTIWEKLICIPT